MSSRPLSKLDKNVLTRSKSSQNELDQGGPGDLAHHHHSCHWATSVNCAPEALLLVQVNILKTIYLKQCESLNRSRGPLGDCGDEFVTYNHSSQVDKTIFKTE